MLTRQLELMKINSSERRCIFSRKRVKLFQDEFFSILNVTKSECILRVFQTETILLCSGLLEKLTVRVKTPNGRIPIRFSILCYQ